MIRLGESLSLTAEKTWMHQRSLSISAMLLKVPIKNAFIDLRGGLRKQSCVRQLFFCLL